jgi:hypothetical protein
MATAVSAPHTRVERRIRLAGLLICSGLLVQLISLAWVHPLAFMAFLLIGCPLVGVGVVIYLWALVS